MALTYEERKRRSDEILRTEAGQKSLAAGQVQAGDKGYTDPYTGKAVNTRKDKTTGKDVEYSVAELDVLDPSSYEYSTSRGLDTTTARGVLAKIYKIGSGDPEKAKKLYGQFQHFSKDPSKSFYSPYLQATNSGMISQLKELGIDVSDGINDEWFKKHSYLKAYYTLSDTSGGVVSPGKRASAEEKAAYLYYQLLKDEEYTKEAEGEWASLQKQIAAWAMESPTLSDEEILSRIDWDEYKTLQKLDEYSAYGAPAMLNRALGYSSDALYGVIWGARNPELSTGNAMNDAVRSVLGWETQSVQAPDKEETSPSLLERIDAGMSRLIPESVNPTMTMLPGYDGYRALMQRLGDGGDNAPSASAPNRSGKSGKVDKTQYTSSYAAEKDALSAYENADFPTAEVYGPVYRPQATPQDETSFFSSPAPAGKPQSEPVPDAFYYFGDGSAQTGDLYSLPAYERQLRAVADGAFPTPQAAGQSSALPEFRTPQERLEDTQMQYMPGRPSILDAQYVDTYTGRVLSYEEYKALIDAAFAQRQEAEAQNQEVQGAKYAAIMQQEDFQNLSQADEQYRRDRSYRYINNIDNYRDAFYDAPQAKETIYDLLSAREIQVYNYLYNTEGKKAANEFLEWMEPALNDRRTRQAVDNAQTVAQEHPFLSSALSVLTTPLSAVAGAAAAGKEFFTGELDANDPLLTPARVKGKILSTVSENINEKMGGGFAGSAMAFGYQLLMSMADSVSASLLGPTGSAFLGGSAMSSTIAEAMDRGASAGDAVTVGVLSGVYETLFERFEIKSLRDLVKTGGSGVVTNILRQSFTEGSEEAFTELANILTDWLVFADESQYHDASAKDIAIQVALSTLGGSLSGGFMGSAATAVNRLKQSFSFARAMREAANGQQLPQAAVENAPGSDIRPVGAFPSAVEAAPSAALPSFKPQGAEPSLDAAGGDIHPAADSQPVSRPADVSADSTPEGQTNAATQETDEKLRQAVQSHPLPEGFSYDAEGQIESRSVLEDLPEEMTVEEAQAAFQNIDQTNVAQWLHNAYEKKNIQTVRRQDIEQFMMQEAAEDAENMAQRAQFYEQLAGHEDVPVVEVSWNPDAQKGDNQTKRILSAAVGEGNTNAEIRFGGENGITARLNTHTINESMRQEDSSQEYRQHLAAALANTQELAESSVYIGSHPDYAEKGRTVGMHYFAAPMFYDEKSFRVLFQIKENLPNKDQPTTTVYLEKVSLLGDAGNPGTEKEGRQQVLKEQESLFPSGQAPTAGRPSEISITQLLSGYNLHRLRNFDMLSQRRGEMTRTQNAPKKPMEAKKNPQDYRIGVNSTLIKGTQLSHQQLQQRHMTEAIAKRYGAKVVLENTIEKLPDGTSVLKATGGQGVNGYYNPADGTIHIALDAVGEAYSAVAVHEIIHQLKEQDAQAYEELEAFVLDVLENNEAYRRFAPEGVDSRVQETMQERKISEALAREELLCDAMTSVLSDKKIVRKLLEEDESIFKKVLKFLEDMLETIRRAARDFASQQGSLEAQALSDEKSAQELRAVFEVMDSVLREANGKEGAKSTGDQKPRESIKRNSKGLYVEADRQVLSGSDPKKWGAQIIRYINEEIRHGRDVVFYAPDGTALTVTRDTAGKAAFKNEIKRSDGTTRRMTDEEYAVKLRAEAHIDELAQVMHNFGETLPDYKKHSFARDGFVYPKAYFKDGDNYYQLTISVGKNGEINTIYNVGKIKEAIFPMVAQRPKPFENGDGKYGSGDIISDSSEKGNFKFSLKPASTVDAAALQKENEQLKKTVDALKAQMELTQGHHVTDYSLGLLAGKTLRQAGSTYSKDQLKAGLREVFDYIANEQQPDMNQVMSQLSSISRDVLEMSREKDRYLWEHFRGFREKMKNTQISLNAEQKAEILQAYGSMENFFRAAGSQFDFHEDGKPLEELWSNLSKRWSTLLSENVSTAEQPIQLVEAMEMIRPQVRNPYGYDLNGHAMDMALQLFDDYFSLPETKKYAQPFEGEKTYDSLKKHYHEQLENLRRATKSQYKKRVWDNRSAKVDELRQQYMAASKADKAKYIKELGELGFDANARLAEVKAAYRAYRHNRHVSAQEKHWRERIEHHTRQLQDMLLRPSDEKHVPEAMGKPLTEFLAAIDFAADGTTKVAARWREKAAALENLLLRYAQSDDILSDVPLLLDPDLAEKLGRLKDSLGSSFTVRDLHGEQLHDLYDVVRGIHHAVTKANQTFAQEKAQSISELASGTVALMQDRAEQKTSKYQILNRALGVTRKLLRYDMLDATSFMESFDEGGQAIFRALRKGLDKRTWQMAEAEEFTEQLKRELGASDRELRQWEKEKVQIELGLDKPETVGISVSQLMELYALSRREQARGHILFGGISLTNEKGQKTGKRYLVSPEQLDGAISKLTDKQKQFIERVQDFLSTTGSQWGNEASMTLYGYKKFGEKNYWPIHSDSDFTQTQQGDQKAAQQSDLHRLRNMGSAKQLTKGANNPLVISSALSTYTGHLADMVNYSSMMPAIEDALRWLNWKTAGKDEEGNVLYMHSVKEGIRRTMGAEGLEYITNLIASLSSAPGRSANNTRLEGVDAMIQGARVANVGFSASVVVQQPTAILRAMDVIDGKWLAAGAGKGIRHGVKLMNEYCAIARWKSMGYMDTDLGGSFSDVILGTSSLRQRAADKSLYLAGKADEVTWGLIWNACEAEKRAEWKKRGEGVTEENREAFYQAVGERMSEVVDRTQVVDTPWHRTQLLRSQNPLTKVLTPYQSEPSKTYNMLYRRCVDVLRAWHTKEDAGKAFAKLVRTLAVHTATAFATSAAYSIIAAIRNNDEEKDFWQQYTESVMDSFKENVNPLGLIPVYSDAFSFLLSKITGKTAYAPSAVGLDSIETLANAIGSWRTYFTSSKNTKSAYAVAYQSVRALSSLTGLPVGNLMRDFNAVVNFASDGRYFRMTALDANVTLKSALYYGDESLARRSLDAIIEKKAAQGNELKEIYSDIRVSLTGYFKPRYLAAHASGDQEEMRRIERILLGVELGGSSYKQSVLEGWLED